MRWSAIDSKALEAGCDDYDTKPVDFKRLVSKIESILRQAIDRRDERPPLLVVDDNEMNRDMLSRRLQRHGYTVMVAVDGKQALELLESEGVRTDPAWTSRCRG